MIPHATQQNTAMHASVREAVPAVLTAVLDELRRLGHGPTRRDAPLDPDIWWER